MTAPLALASGILRDLGLPLPGQSRTYDVDGKVVLITGGGNGIGLALAHTLHARGAIVALVDADSHALAKAESALGHQRVVTVTADVRDRAAMRATVAELTERAGRLDVVVANAGVTPPPATLRQTAPEEFDRVLDINLVGAFNTVHPAIDEVINNRGHVLVVSSAAAFVPGPGGASYMVSKAGVEALGRALRLELSAHNVTVGVAYFGVVHTQLAATTLDADSLGNRLQLRLPAPLRTRISAERAATVLADAISRRAGRTLAPGAWQPWALLRGMVNVAADAYLAADRQCQALIRELESRASHR